jgi:hypothetical protein
VHPPWPSRRFFIKVHAGLSPPMSPPPEQGISTGFRSTRKWVMALAHLRPFLRPAFLAILSLAMLAGSCESSPNTHPAQHQFSNPAGAGARLPRLSAAPGGGVLMSWVEPHKDGYVLKFAVRQDSQWKRQGEVARGANWFINWADFPSVVALDSSFWAAHWLVRHPDGRPYEYDIALSVSNDGGATWSAPQQPHRDQSAAEHGFATIFPVEGQAGIIWLDGREYTKDAPRNSQGPKSGNFALRSTQFGPDGTMGPEQVMDDNTCTCCWTAVAVTSLGPIASWRGRTDNDIRDHRLARWRQGDWSAPMPLDTDGWHIAGCPTNGPALAARGLRVAAAWFTAAGDRPRVRAAISLDGGQHFGVPVDLDEREPLGRTGVAWLAERKAVVSWIGTPDTVTGPAPLAIRTLTIDGALGPVQIIARISAGRDSGVPQLISTDSGLLLAWTDAAPGYGIRTIEIPTDAIDR